MRGVRIAAVAIALGVCVLNVSAKAQVTYTVVPSQCGTVVNPMQCTLDLSPANQLGIYPTLQMTDDLIKDTGGLVDWSTTQGPTGQYLGSGVIQYDSATQQYRSYPTFSQICSNGACTTQATSVTVYFTGTYIGGGTYAGLYTLHMSYKHQYSYRTGWKWIRAVTGGLVTISQ